MRIETWFDVVVVVVRRAWRHIGIVESVQLHALADGKQPYESLGTRRRGVSALHVNQAGVLHSFPHLVVQLARARA